MPSGLGPTPHPRAQPRPLPAPAAPPSLQAPPTATPLRPASMVVLKGIPALLSPELLYALARMGHGDTIGESAGDRAPGSGAPSSRQKSGAAPGAGVGTPCWGPGPFGPGPHARKSRVWRWSHCLGRPVRPRSRTHPSRDSGWPRPQPWLWLAPGGHEDKCPWPGQG